MKWYPGSAESFLWPISLLAEREYLFSAASPLSPPPPPCLRILIIIVQGVCAPCTNTYTQQHDSPRIGPAYLPPISMPKTIGSACMNVWAPMPIDKCSPWNVKKKYAALFSGCFGIPFWLARSGTRHRWMVYTHTLLYRMHCGFSY